MSSLHKDADHAFDRVNSYLNGMYTDNDKTTNVKAHIPIQTLSLETDPLYFKLWLKRDCGRFDLGRFLDESAEGGF